MVTRSAGPTKPPGGFDFKGNTRPPSAGWRPSRERERLGLGVWIAGLLLATAVLALMAVLFGAA
ncbi:MAG: hypothetical protein PHT60_11455 [Acidiphilium sp.]|nr:hypothetical protein [Acidiphilium sp.]MDD4936380.1 hypothetical protein [Acidiphilium sp.]